MGRHVWGGAESSNGEDHPADDKNRIQMNVRSLLFKAMADDSGGYWPW